MSGHRSNTFNQGSATEPLRNPGRTFRIACFVPEGAAEPVFSATGSVEDEGSVEGTPLPVNEDRSAWIGYRMLRGRKGLLFLLVETRFVRVGSTIARGTFEVTDGTEAYAGLRGAGDFCAAFDAEGHLVEVFSGRLSGAP
jgi:hypothetical protein